jgi:hypothetical protein
MSGKYIVNLIMSLYRSIWQYAHHYIFLSLKTQRGWCITDSSTIAVLYFYKLFLPQLLHILNVFTYVNFSFSWMSSSWFKLRCSLCAAGYQHDSKELFHISAGRQIPSFRWRLTLWIHKKNIEDFFTNVKYLA